MIVFSEFYHCHILAGCNCLEEEAVGTLGQDVADLVREGEAVGNLLVLEVLVVDNLLVPGEAAGNLLVPGKAAGNLLALEGVVGNNFDTQRGYV